MALQFASYRRFEASRAAANDAMMALLIGARIASSSLAGLEPQGRSMHLPELFPEVPDVQRMNRTAEDASELLTHAEKYLAYMGIPFVLSVYQTLAVDAIRGSRLRRGESTNSGSRRSPPPLEHSLTW